jgi:hypothetical protein
MRFARPTMVVLLLLGACRSRGRSDEGVAGAAGRLSANWIGADTGKLNGPARAGWCDDDHRLELTAVQGDAGVGLALYPVADLRPGTYAASLPAADSTPHRPGVTGAARWFTDKAIAAYQSDSGALELSVSRGTLAGTFDFHMHALDGTDTVRLSGRFSGVRPGVCAADSLPDSVSAAPDSQ